MTEVIKIYNVCVQGMVLCFTHEEATELLNALDSAINNKTYVRPGEWKAVNLDDYIKDQPKHTRDKYFL